MKSLEQKVAELLRKQNKAISVAESCTGGLVSDRLTNIPGISTYFKAAIVAYRRTIKIKLLKIPSRIIAKNGTVSKPVAIMMARNIRRICETDIGLGVTGIAGPSGGTKEKPVGLVYIALATKNYEVARKLNFKGSRLAVKKQASSAVLKLLYDFLAK
ncbi:MAG: CinA family protein [Candidatus Omnitrophica bacterium]|nr:CinA family protein [Candidatus Omnitrophota bacterium]